MSPHLTGLRRLSAAGALAAALLVLLLPVSASAHSELQSSDPAEGTVVPSPFSGPVVMTFTESLAVGSKADLYGPGHQLVASATIDAGTMTVSPPSPLTAGAYTVEWVSIADDGDLLRGTLAFSVAAGASSPTLEASPTVEPSAFATNPPGEAGSPATAATSGPATPASSAATSSGTGGSGTDVILPIVIVLVAAAGGAFYLVRRNRPA